MKLSKTDFKNYLICPKYFWLKKKRPEEIEEGELSLFFKKLIREGYEVERKAHELFPSGVNISRGLNDEESIEKTKELMKEKGTIFQATFQTEEELFIEVDILKFNTETEKWDIYEVKSSSAVKTDLQHNHIKDVTFQKIVMEKSGIEIGKVFIVHINKEYIRNGEVNIDELLIKEDVTLDVNEVEEKTLLEINNALKFLERDEISMQGCNCVERSHGQRCDTFYKFNPHVPKYSTAHILAGNKLLLLNDMDIFDPKEIPDDFELTDIQRTKVELQKTGIPQINHGAIKEIISGLEYPLYFFDYETAGKPIPYLDGYRANQQIVFQYSLHKLEKDGSLEHFEYLADDRENATSNLVKQLKSEIGEKGSIIVWYESFEKGRNHELGELHPEYKDFLKDLNNRIFDLMKIFKKNYLHPDFFGSASIKKVLPIIVPELSYEDLDVQDGTMAMSAWDKMLGAPFTKGGFEEDKFRKKIKKDLLEYCKLDTLAMVEIYKKLLEEIGF